MQKEIDKKDFDLLLAQQGHPLVTRDGREVKFVDYVGSGNDHNKVVVLIEGAIFGFSISGTYYKEASSKDLFLAPVGYCEGLPVWPGDKLIAGGAEITIENASYPWHSMKWPSSNVVVKTRMTRPEILDIFNASPNDSEWETVANKAIERAIADGDVIPTSEVIKLVDKAITKWALGTDRDPYGPKDYFGYALQDYKDSLTK